MEKVLGIIPARGGSKGLPNKNIMPLGGIPLISRTIRTALASGVLDSLVVSTDSSEIAATASAEKGVEVLNRPPELAGDSSLVMDAIRHVISTREAIGHYYKYMILLQVTSPFRTVDDIRECVRLLRGGADSVISFSETKEPPARIWRIQDNSISQMLDTTNPFLPRQALEPGYFINGVMYGVRVEDIKNNPGTFSLMFGRTVPMITPIERAADIDTEIDFRMAEAYMRLTGDPLR